MSVSRAASSFAAIFWEAEADPYGLPRTVCEKVSDRTQEVKMPSAYPCRPRTKSASGGDQWLILPSSGRWLRCLRFLASL